MVEHDGRGSVRRHAIPLLPLGIRGDSLARLRQLSLPGWLARFRKWRQCLPLEDAPTRRFLIAAPRSTYRTQHFPDSLILQPLGLLLELPNPVLLLADELPPSPPVLSEYLLDHHQVTHGLILDLEYMLSRNAIHFCSLRQALESSAVLTRRTIFGRLVEGVFLADDGAAAVSEQSEGLR